MLRLTRIILSLAFLSMCIGRAEATTLTGFFDGSGVGIAYFQVSIQGADRPGSHDFVLSIAAPGPIADAFTGITYNYSQSLYFDDGSGVSYGGADYNIETDMDFFGQSGVIEGFSVPKNRIFYFPDGNVEETDVFSPAAILLNLTAPELANRTFSYAVTPAPEPAEWSLMVVGFALVGGSIRSARRPRPADLMRGQVTQT